MASRPPYPDVDMTEVEEHALFLAKNHQRRGSNYKVAFVTGGSPATAWHQVFRLLVVKPHRALRR